MLYSVLQLMSEPSYQALTVASAGGTWLLDEVLRFQSEQCVLQCVLHCVLPRTPCSELQGGEDA